MCVFACVRTCVCLCGCFCACGCVVCLCVCVGGGGVETSGGHRNEIRSVPYGEGKQTPDFR